MNACKGKVQPISGIRKLGNRLYVIDLACGHVRYATAKHKNQSAICKGLKRTEATP